jgi:hypothetical protein
MEGFLDPRELAFLSEGSGENVYSTARDSLRLSI